MSGSIRNKKRKQKNTVSGRAQKYRSMVIGAILILVGLGSIMYTFDYSVNLNSLFDLSKLKDWFSLWPFWLTILGFIFVIYDYIKNSSKQKYK